MYYRLNDVKCWSYNLLNLMLRDGELNEGREIINFMVYLKVKG